MIHHSGIRIQRGHGLFGFLGSLARKIIPSATKLSKNVVRTIGKSDIAKDIGLEMKNLAKDSLISAASNALEGRSVKEGLKTDLQTAKKAIAKQIRKRKQSNRNQKKSKKPKKANIANRAKFNFMEQEL